MDFLPNGVWSTKIYFIRCMNRNKLHKIVYFFNSMNRYLYKNLMLSLCVRFLSKNQLHEILSNINIIISNTKIKDKYKEKLDLYSNLFSSSYTGLEEDEIVLEKDLALNEQELLQEHSRIDSKNIKKKYKLKQLQINFLISRNILSETWIVVMYMIQGNSYEDLKKILSTEKINSIFRKLTFESMYYLINYCPLVSLCQILIDTDILTNSHINILIEIVERKEILNLIVETLIKKVGNISISRLQTIIYCNFSLLKMLCNNNTHYDRFGELVSLLTKESLDFLLYSKIAKNTLVINLLIRYININASTNANMDYINTLIESALEANEFNLIQYIYSKKELNLLILVSYCYDVEDKQIDETKAYKIILILKNIQKHFNVETNLNYIKKCKKMISFIERKLSIASS